MNENVLITGGSRGIGAALVKKFAENGCGVAFLYEKNDKAANELAKQTGALPIRCDIGIEDDVEAAVKDALKKMKIEGFDIVICNAGISYIGVFDGMRDDTWRRVIDVNLTGNIKTVKVNLPYMISNKGGSVVMVSSMWGQTGASCEVAYSTSKAAIIGFTKSLAKELGPSGIRVNCVAPGLVDTEMNAEISAETLKELEEDIPLMRSGSGDEIAEAVFFLASDKASYITGQILGVNGGSVC